MTTITITTIAITTPLGSAIEVSPPCTVDVDFAAAADAVDEEDDLVEPDAVDIGMIDIMNVVGVAADLRLVQSCLTPLPFAKKLSTEEAGMLEPTQAAWASVSIDCNVVIHPAEQGFDGIKSEGLQSLMLLVYTEEQADDRPVSCVVSKEASEYWPCWALTAAKMNERVTAKSFILPFDSSQWKLVKNKLQA